MSFHTEFLKEPWFSLIKFGIKTVEARLNMGLYKTIQKNDVIEFYNDNFGDRNYKCKVTDVRYYQTFNQYLQEEKIENCLPGISTLEDCMKIYEPFRTKMLEDIFGVVCFEISNQ